MPGVTKAVPRSDVYRNRASMIIFYRIIKFTDAVLRPLVPELTYKGTEVGDGGMAMDAYCAMCGAEDIGYEPDPRITP